MAVHADNYMIFLEILRLVNTSRRREVKERVNPLTKYDYSEFHAWFRLSKLTVYHLLSDVCQTVRVPIFRNILRSVYCENHGKSLQLWMILQWPPSGTTPCGMQTCAYQRQPTTLGGAFTNVCHRPTYVYRSVTSDFCILMIKSEYCDYFPL